MTMHVSPGLSNSNHKDPGRRPIQMGYCGPLLECPGESILGSVFWIATLTEGEPQGSTDPRIVGLEELFKGIVRRGRHHFTTYRGPKGVKRLLDAPGSAAISELTGLPQYAGPGCHLSHDGGLGANHLGLGGVTKGCRVLAH